MVANKRNDDLLLNGPKGLYSFSSIVSFSLLSVMLSPETYPHFCKKQDSIIYEDPEQTPPNFSFTVFVRVFVRVPSPHVFGHCPVCHGLHSQLTKSEQEVKNAFLSHFVG